VDCTYDKEFIQTRAHHPLTCLCDVGNKYSNQVCECEGHICSSSGADLFVNKG
jgi:hypothetical protein